MGDVQMEAISECLKSTVPEEVFLQLKSHLQFLRVNTIRDLQYITEQDLCVVLKQVHCRMILAIFREPKKTGLVMQCESLEALNESFTLPMTSPLHLPSTSAMSPMFLQEINVSNNPSETESVVQCESSAPINYFLQVPSTSSSSISITGTSAVAPLPLQEVSNFRTPVLTIFEKFTKYSIAKSKNVSIAIRNVLDQGTRPQPSMRRDLVRSVVNDLIKISPRPRRRELEVVAKNVVSTYSSSLEGRISGEVMGSGYFSFLSQLDGRVQNITRDNKINLRQNKKRLNPTSENAPPTKKAVRDSYGCVRFNPTITNRENMENIQQYMLRAFATRSLSVDEIQMEIEKSYPLQREDLNGNLSIGELLTKWPYLFTEKGLLHHSEIILGIDVLQSLKASLMNKLEVFFQYFRTCHLPAIQQVTNEILLAKKMEQMKG